MVLLETFKFIFATLNVTKTLVYGFRKKKYIILTIGQEIREKTSKSAIYITILVHTLSLKLMC